MSGFTYGGLRVPIKIHASPMVQKTKLCCNDSATVLQRFRSGSATVPQPERAAMVLQWFCIHSERLANEVVNQVATAGLD